MELFDAEMVMNAASFSFLDMVEERESYLFLYHYSELRDLRDPRSEFSIEQSVALIRLEEDVKALALRFCDATMSCQPGQAPAHGNHSMSKNEARRIYRAFFRCEIYAKIFSASGSYREIQVAYTQATFLFGKVPWHEIEELDCVRVYASNQFRALFEKVRGQLLNEVSLDDGYASLFLAESLGMYSFESGRRSYGDSN